MMRRSVKRFNYNAGVELAFSKRLTLLFNELVADVKKLVPHQYAMDGDDLDLPPITPDNIESIINTLLVKYVAKFGNEGIGITQLMTAALLQTSYTSINRILEEVHKRESKAVLFTRESPKMESPFYLNKNMFSSPELQTYTKSVIAETVSLIKTIPEKYLSQVREIMYESLTNGENSVYINDKLGNLSSRSKRNIQLLSLDQTRKIYTKITAYRMQQLGAKEFMWIHSGGGQHPRPSHVKMNGKIFRFDDLPIINADDKKATPERGLPGQAINCKCQIGFVYDY